MSLTDNVEKFKRIAEGWKNVVFLSPMVEELAEVRAKICSTCPRAVESKWMQMIGDRIEEASGIKCNHCGCPISSLARSVKSICPDIPRKW